MPGSPLVADIALWRAEQAHRSGFAVARRPLTQVARWTLGDDALAHDTGGFFRVLGIETRARDDAGGPDMVERQPFIDQPEIGILGFLSRRKAGGRELLVQAKTEPGNIGAVQLAPTFQCTPSNYERRHAGTVAPYLDLFRDADAGAIVADARQSEQGSRFLGKRNRNMLVEVTQAQAPEPADAAWRWLPAADVLRLLAWDNVLNTDARSVLVSAPWDRLADGPAFAGWRGRGGFGEAVAQSHAAADDAGEETSARLAAWLARHRAARQHLHARLPLAAIPGWRLAEAGLVPDIAAERPGGFAVHGFDVRARDREVPEWQQPLVESTGEGTVTLLCQRRRGILHLLLRAIGEAGLANRVEVTASLQVAPGAAMPAPWRTLHAAAEDGRAAVRLACRQSEEGGRFFQDSNLYRVVELPEDMAVPMADDLRWATVRQFESLCRTPGTVTNEGRSAASLLLSLAGGPA
ncbi:NDP-hexose 2,3-dehydratase family protein [Allostella humosa]|uniref:NDP-hexose 2,3-dehydratase family protein n=1 Tax=Stella humosa TaxID=94 RepID=UPI00147758A6|nr:NDP-hexose 2,3-dehydratase family protein [Stella humosa]